MNASADGTWTADSGIPADSPAAIFPFPVQPIAARRQLRQAVVAALKRANLAVGTAAVAVDSPGDFPYPQAKLPAICVRGTTDGKESLTKGNTEYTDTVEIHVGASVAATTGEAAQDAIEILWYQIEQALLCDYYLLEIIQNVSRIESAINISAEGQVHIGSAAGRFRFETFETFDISQSAGAVVAPSVASPLGSLTEVTVDVTKPGSNPPYSEQPGDVGLTLTLPGD